LPKKKLFNASLHTLLLTESLQKEYEVIDLNKEALTIDLKKNLQHEQIRIIEYLIKNVEPGSYVYTSGHPVLTSAVFIACDLIPAHLVYCFIDTSTGRVFDIQPVYRSLGSIPRKIRLSLEELKKEVSF